MNDNLTFSSVTKTSATLPRNLPPVEQHSTRCPVNTNNRSIVGAENGKLKSTLKRTETSIQEAGAISSGALCRMHEAEANAISTKPRLDDTLHNMQGNSHFSSSSLQSSSSSGSTTASTATCKFQNSPPSTLPNPSSSSPEAPSNFRDNVQPLRRDVVPLTDPASSSIKRSSTAASINAIIQKPQKLTTFCIPESQIVISPPPKEFETTTSKIKSPLPSALSTSSSSSGIAGSSTSPASSPTVSFAEKPTYA